MIPRVLAMLGLDAYGGEGGNAAKPIKTRPNDGDFSSPEGGTTNNTSPNAYTSIDFCPKNGVF
jgi:hypothetical protein